MWSSPRPPKFSAPAPPPSVAHPTPTAVRCAPACPAPCPYSTRRCWNLPSRPVWPWGVRSPKRAALTGRTTSTLTCPRPIRFPSSTCPLPGTAGWTSAAARRWASTSCTWRRTRASWSTTPGPTRPAATTTAAACPSSRLSPSPTSAPPRRSFPIWSSCAPPSSTWACPTAKCRRAPSAAT
ncbi:Uncharacterised protein [uncultured Flavonifractor sp.]|nr:Uncharacterised protein [uncultured Flavonifractor sp.]